jgi:hypothetical protein
MHSATWQAPDAPYQSFCLSVVVHFYLSESNQLKNELVKFVRDDGSPNILFNLLKYCLHPYKLKDLSTIFFADLNRNTTELNVKR